MSASSSSSTPPMPTRFRVSQKDPLHFSNFNGITTRNDVLHYIEPAMFRIKMEQSNLTNKSMFLLPSRADHYYCQGGGSDDIDESLNNNSIVSTIVEEGTLGWSNPKVQVLFAGSRRPDGNESSFTPITLLRNFETTLLRSIMEFVCCDYAKYIAFTIPAALVAATIDGTLVRYTFGRHRPNHRTRHALPCTIKPKSTGYSSNQAYVAFSKCGQVIFPKPTIVQQNNHPLQVIMMPFVLGDVSSLPENLQGYYNLIEQCPYMQDEVGKVAYLTVYEQNVDMPIRNDLLNSTTTNDTSDSFLPTPNIRVHPYKSMFQQSSHAIPSFRPGIEVPKSVQLFFGPDRYESGIYMACNSTGSIYVWDAIVDKAPLVDRKLLLNTRYGLDCQKLLPLLGNCKNHHATTTIHGGDLIWMTDATPHEITIPSSSSSSSSSSLSRTITNDESTGTVSASINSSTDTSSSSSSNNSVYQFFQLVMPSISYWDANLYTPNPKVPLPNDVSLIRRDG